MSKEKNQILILLALVLFGVLYAYVQYLFLPQLSILKDKTAYLTAREAYLQKLEDNSKILSSLKSQVVVLNTQAAKLEQEIPIYADKPDMMLTIYNMAKRFGLSPLSLNYSPLQEEDGYYTMGIDFTCKGPEHQVYALVRSLLRNTDYIFALDNISIRPGTEGVSANMHFIAYFYHEQSSP
ncbi:MAG TPA: type 4a pilus biogenesis protein PilO [Peptococcaceae bacterium]|nr:type 4a pilus biogenesis protein PilO [Peptococcaceae bacterium]